MLLGMKETEDAVRPALTVEGSNYPFGSPAGVSFLDHWTHRRFHDHRPLILA